MRSQHQRAQGELQVRVGRRDGRTVLRDLRQQGCLKARFPHPVGAHETVTLNTSGGVAGGDRLESVLHVEAGACAVFASQAAERFYRALPGDPPAHVRTELRVEAGARAEWLPQESILFDGCAVDRVLTIDMADDARVLGVEALMFGRTAMGERVGQARLSDTIRVRRGGRLVLHDAIRIAGAADALEAKAGLDGHRASATVFCVAPDAEGRLEGLRAAWEAAPAETGASAWNGMLVARILAPDAARLRATLVMGLNQLRDGRAVPRVWMC